MLLFIFVLNIGSVLATKEKSATTAKQASMSATSVVYEEARRAILNYDNSEHEDPDDGPHPIWMFFHNFVENVEERLQQMRWDSRYFSMSANERELRAMSYVIDQGLQTPLVNQTLKDLFLNEGIKDKAIAKAKDVIVKNGGTLTGAEMRIKDNTIEIKAANKFKSTRYKQFLSGVEESVFQISSGPEISFLNSIFSSNQTIELE